MAKFLFFIQPAIGHVNPTLPISRKLVEQGHQVAWIAGKVFKHEVEKTGALYFPQPAAMDWGEQPLYEFFPELAKLQGLKQVLWYAKQTLDFIPLQLEAIDGVLEHFEANVLLGDLTTHGVYAKSELSGIPCAMISVTPLALPSRDTAPFGLGLLPGKGPIAKARNWLLNYLIDSVILRDVKAHAGKVRRQLGLPDLQGSISKALFPRSCLVLQLTTPAFEYPRSDQPKSIHFVGPVLPEGDPAFSQPEWWPDLMTDRPVVLITQGTVATGLEGLIEPAIQGLKNEDMLILAVPVYGSMAQPVPANVRIGKFIPFAHLLPHVDVMVTNGGYGGTQMALAHGVPLVVAGATEDHMEVAARVEWAGAGINLRRHLSPSSIRNAVKEVLHDPTYRQNAQRIQRDFAQYNAPKLAAKRLESLANQQEEFVQS